MTIRFLTTIIFDSKNERFTHNPMVVVKLNVYDLAPFNELLRFSGIGIYHTSVVIDDQHESYYGFAEYGYTGIDTPEELNYLPSSMRGTRYETIIMGKTELSYEECYQVFLSFKADPEWLSDHYNALYHNCNTYTYALCKALLGENGVSNYPHWIKRGEYIGQFIYAVSFSHFLGFSRELTPLGRQYIPKKVVLEQLEENSVEDADKTDKLAL